MDQDSKQGPREAREAFILESRTLPSIATQAKCTSQKPLTTFSEQMAFTDESNQIVESDCLQGHTHLTVPGNRYATAVCLAT